METEYRIDDLAHAAGMTVRNVRVYQDRGLLPPPRRDGRVGWYSQAHLARLRTIGRLLERGYAFAQISELLGALENGRDLADVLGLEQVLTDPWGDEQPVRYSLVDLRRLFGEQATKAAIDRAVQLGLLHRHRTGFEGRSPKLVQAGAALVAAGIGLPVVLDLVEALMVDMDTMARRIVTLVAEDAVPLAKATSLSSSQLSAVTDTVRRLRPHARQAVDALFTRAIEHQVDLVVAQYAQRAQLEQRAAGQTRPAAG